MDAERPANALPRIAWERSQNTLKDFWEDNDIKEYKPARHRSWFQVWRFETRKFVPFKKKGSAAQPQPIYMSTATPWIDTSGIVKSPLTTEFRALQEYVTTAPSKLKGENFEKTVGYKISEHEEKYTRPMVGSLTGTVVPFTLEHLFFTELGGEGKAKEVTKELYEKIGGSEWAAYMNIDPANISEAQITALRAKIQDEADKNLGYLKDAQDAIDKITPDIIIELEESLQETANGLIGDSAQDMLNDFELPDSFDSYCELP